ncbi:hypothetical protein UCDDS831_g00110 [Diplodia seriata]|uniref:DUF6594 domain-containing protein n=2 Tax=Diplodia seriata TaxID=420778 RepID=A0A0G2HK51_9PEZI|nr:hypothetical protein UCDDS831_g00110 [Diplodia seriata]
MGPHRGMALFKRFAVLNARNLLYMQAELLDLERELDVIAEMDREDGRPFDVEALKLMSPDPGEPDDEQRQLVLKLRRKLKEYNEALLQQAKINKLEKANKYDLHVLNGWLRQEQGGDNFLLGVEARPWQEQRDLVALSSRQHDTLTKYMSETLVPWLHRQGLHRPKKMDEEAGLVEWDDGSYSTASRVLSVVASSIIPGAAVVTLYHIQDLLARIFAALAFSAIFSLALALLTTARPAEIFAATAAFASVQVVFIGSTSTS